MTASDTPSPPTTAPDPAAAAPAAEGASKGAGKRPRGGAKAKGAGATPTAPSGGAGGGTTAGAGTGAGASLAAAAPSTDDTLAPEGAKVDIRNLQDKFNGMLDQRNQFNDLARAAREGRDQLNEQRRQKALEIEENKKARDAANEEMRVHKELRNAYQDQAKALIGQKKGKAGAIERSLPLTVRKLRNDLQAMVEQQQTTTLTIAKERVLVEKIAETWKELKGKEAELAKQKAVEVELTGTDNDIDSLFAKADEEHAIVTQHMKVAQEHHEKFIAAVKEVRVLVGEANKKHDEFVARKQKADGLHQKAMELREKVMQIRGERKAEYDARRKEIQEVNQVARRNVSDPRAIERAKEDAFEQLKKGGKITLGF
jgi:uncharacterized coiled-coil DUF342 family protein